MRGAWGVVLAVAVLGLVAAGTATASEGNLTLAIGENGNVTAEDPNGWIVDATHEPPDHYAWDLTLTEDYQVAHVVIDRGFPIEDGRQLKPLVDDRHFVETPDVTDVDRAADVFHLDETEETWRYGLGIEGANESRLTLTRDTEAPTVEIVSVDNRTDIGFDVKTNTSEIAEAELFVREPGGQILQNYPTRPGPWQEFPVQGLDANTTYQVFVEARDWSRNEGVTETIEVTTKESEEPPKPVVEPVRPAPNATVTRDSVVVEASVEDGGWPIVEQDVRLFFDKERVDPSKVEISDGTITYRPQEDLDPRKYSVSVEVPNTAGGTGIARWSFHVQDSTAKASPGPAGILSILLGAGLLALRRRS